MKNEINRALVAKKKIYLFAVAVMTAVTLMAQELPTACDATIEFKYCFTTYGTDAKTIYSSDLPLTWNGVTFPADGTYPMEQNATLTNARGCDSVVTMTVSIKGVPVGAAGGSHARAFSVGENKKVYFSQGNLQYRALDKYGNELKRTCADETEQVGIFRFAENQYDYVGAVGQSISKMAGNVYNENGKCSNDNNKQKTTSWLDFFAWGASGYGSTLPYSWDKNWYLQESGIDSNLDETNYDWGVYNPITNGGNEPGLWRSMSSAEWCYVFTQRENAEDRVTRAIITDGGTTVASGVVLFPDDWSVTEVSGSGITVNLGVSSMTGTAPYRDINLTSAQQKWSYNSFTKEEWAILEATGAVFMPAGGDHYTEATAYYGDPEGTYYTSTKQDETISYNKYSNGDYIIFNSMVRIYRASSATGAQYRRAVRLVTDL